MFKSFNFFLVASLMFVQRLYLHKQWRNSVFRRHTQYQQVMFFNFSKTFYLDKKTI